MKKSLTLSLFITVSLSTIALATDSKSTNFKLDNKIADAYKINETSKTSTQKLEKATKQKTPSPNHKIIKENILGGYVEKLLDDEGLVIAEKKVVDNKIIESTINEYHPNKKISKKIISRGEDNGFYVEEYYPNGNISKEASYINDQNKLGIEKRYDTKGVLRQEIPWVAVNDKTSKTNAEITTKREGELKTYYPNSKIAAIFSVGKKGNNIFLNEHGGMVKHISNAELLDFSKEDLVEDCQGISL